MKKWSNVLLMTISLLLTLYLAEFILGRFMVKSLPYHQIPPGSQQTHKTPEFSAVYHYNNHSFRGDDFTFGEPVDVIMIGDSFLFGQGVEEDLTVYGQLKKSGLYSVLNLSEFITEPTHYYHRLKVASRYNTQAKEYIDALFFGNDFTRMNDSNIDYLLTHQYPENVLEYTALSFLTLERIRYALFSAWHNYNGELYPHYFERPRTFYPEWIRWYTNNNQQAMSLMYNQHYIPRSEEDYLTLTQLTPESVEKVARLINNMATLIPDNSRLHLLLIPDLHYIKGELGERYDAMRSALISHLSPKIELIDLHGIVTEKEYFLDDGHWNIRGNRIVAEQLLKRLGNQPK